MKKSQITEERLEEHRRIVDFAWFAYIGDLILRRKPYRLGDPCGPALYALIRKFNFSEMNNDPDAERWRALFRFATGRYKLNHPKLESARRSAEESSDLEFFKTLLALRKEKVFSDPQMDKLKKFLLTNWVVEDESSRPSLIRYPPEALAKLCRLHLGFKADDFSKLSTALVIKTRQRLWLDGERCGKISHLPAGNGTKNFIPMRPLQLASRK